MADWAADNTMSNGGVNGDTSSLGSHNSSMRSDRSNRSLTKDKSDGVDDGSDSDRVILTGGRQLVEESRTESVVYENAGFHSAKNEDSPVVPPRQPTGPTKKKTIMKFPGAPGPNLTPVESIPEEDIEIPSDGCLFNFTADNMATFFRYMRIEERLVNHLHRKGIDGKKFSKLKDSELETIGIKNPVVCYFRDKSRKKRVPFML